jgi:hypothetical protein
MIGLAASATAPVAASGAAAAPPAIAARSTCAAPALGGPTRLSTADNGRVLCVGRGQRIEVVLAVDPVDGTVPGQWWKPVRLRGGALTELPNTLMAIRGTTLGYFGASTRGGARLSSLRRPCVPPPPGGVSCDTIEFWSVTVLVR